MFFSFVIDVFSRRIVGWQFAAHMRTDHFVDTFKTELIRDRVWRTRSQLELAIVEYVSWFNTDRLHESLGDLPPTEFETLAATR